MPADTNTSQSNYAETPYADQSWPALGEVTDNSSFEAIDIPVIGEATSAVDPMFADFGGRLGIPQGESWKTVGGARAAAKEEEEDPNLIKILPQDLEAIKQEAYQRGLQEAQAKAAEELQTQLQSIEQSINGVLQDLGAQVTENLKELERNAVDLALAISQKIIHHSVEINPEYISQIIAQAFEHAGSATIKRVRVSAQDLEFIEVVGLPKSLADAKATWKFEADETVKAGCVVETSAGEIDFRLDEAWERIKDNVVKAAR